MIYLDNAATTQIHPEVLDVMMPYLTEFYGNAGSLYNLGRKSSESIEKARKQVADFIGCTPEHIVFTSGGTESNNMVFSGLRNYLIENDKTHIITSSVEHDSVINSVNALVKSAEKNKRDCIKPVFYSDFLPVNNKCQVSTEFIKDLINENTGLVSVMYVNNETGAINPINEIGAICKENNVLFHTDCVQAAGMNTIDVEKINCDFLSISSHKIHGPKGVGALYVRDTNIIMPIINGGAMQEYGLRGGTENVAGIVGFGKACEIAYKNQIDAGDFIVELKNEFLQHLSNSKYIFHLNSYSQYSKVINLRVDDIDAQTLLLMLDNKDICVSAGSACRSHESEPSRVLLATGLTPEQARCSIRISFSTFNNIKDAKLASEAIIDCVKILKDGIDKQVEIS